MLDLPKQEQCILKSQIDEKMQMKGIFLETQTLQLQQERDREAAATAQGSAKGARWPFPEGRHAVIAQGEARRPGAQGKASGSKRGRKME